MGAMQTIPTSLKGDYPVVPAGLSVVTWAKDRWPSKLILTQVTNTDGPYMMSPEYKEWLKSNLGERETTRRERIFGLIKNNELGSCREDIMEAVTAAYEHDLRKKRRHEREKKKAEERAAKKPKKN